MQVTGRNGQLPRWRSKSLHGPVQGHFSGWTYGGSSRRAAECARATHLLAVRARALAVGGFSLEAAAHSEMGDREQRRNVGEWLSERQVASLARRRQSAAQHVGAAPAHHGVPACGRHRGVQHHVGAQSAYELRSGVFQEESRRVAGHDGSRSTRPALLPRRLAARARTHSAWLLAQPRLHLPTLVWLPLQHYYIVNVELSKRVGMRSRRSAVRCRSAT